VPNVDAAFARARDFGARALEEPKTHEYGERSCVFEDLAGHRWELTETVRDVEPEEWGGTTQFSEVSAREKQNLDDLLERVLLVADAELELKANPSADASGPIIESRLDVGRGPVATMLVHRGTLRVGDAIVAGDAWGKVRALQDFRGEKVNEATPGDPVEILGFDHPPPAGEVAKVVENERAARGFAQVRWERLRREQMAQGGGSGGISLETLFSQLQEGAVQDLNLVLKGDVVGSVEAAVSELGKIQHPEVRVNVIHQGVGAITENDIMLASASNAMVVGFNVRPNAEARSLAVLSSPRTDRGIVQSVSASALVLKTLDRSTLVVRIDKKMRAFVNGKAGSILAVKPGFVAVVRRLLGQPAREVWAFGRLVP